MKTLVILAGGMSSRMGSDKAVLGIDEETFIERIYRNALVNFSRIIISVDSDVHASRIRSLPLFSRMKESIGAAGITGGEIPEMVTDVYPEKGPMGGLLSVLEKTDVSAFSVIPTDVPGADMRVLARLYDICIESGKKCACLRMTGGKREPLIAAYSRGAMENLERALKSGNNKLGMAFDTEEVKTVSEKQLKLDLDYKKAFANYNTPEEYKELC